MNRQNAPAFRTALNGYRKEDVNSYIINMSKRYNESEADLKAEIEALKQELSRRDTEIEELSEKAEKAAKESETIISALYVQNDAADAEVKKYKADVEEKQAVIDALTKQISENETVSLRKNDFGGITDPSEKAELFDCISSKTGEIMLIACKTADDIIAQAKNEAEQIVNEANAKKDSMLRSISGSAETVTSDISTYIKSAVDGCLEKIYSSIKSVDGK